MPTVIIIIIIIIIVLVLLQSSIAVIMTFVVDWALRTELSIHCSLARLLSYLVRVCFCNVNLSIVVSRKQDDISYYLPGETLNYLDL